MPRSQSPPRGPRRRSPSPRRHRDADRNDGDRRRDDRDRDRDRDVDRRDRHDRPPSNRDHRDIPSSGRRSRSPSPARGNSSSDITHKSRSKAKELSFYKKSGSGGGFRRDVLDGEETSKDRMERRERGEVPARFGGTREQGVRNTMSSVGQSQGASVGSLKRTGDPLDRMPGVRGGGSTAASGGGGGNGGAGPGRASGDTRASDADKRQQERLAAMGGGPPPSGATTGAGAGGPPSGIPTYVPSSYVPQFIITSPQILRVYIISHRQWYLFIQNSRADYPDLEAEG